MRTKQQVFGIILGILLFVQPAIGEDRVNLAGSWTLVSLFTEDVQTKARHHVYGEHPQGHLSITPGGRFYSFATADWRRFGTSPPQQIEFRSIFSSGKYRLDRGKFIFTTETVRNEGWEGADPVELSWSDEWVASEQLRFYSLAEDKSETTQLRMHAAITNPDGSANTLIGHLIWTRQ